ncbi:putative RNA-directed DNA polymerase [Helianthus annuus]|nr:putative RNA-directed DNA polymerase [Helianthus annuus]KAJ0625922.1 putative RNA-directed DNA polymerase [Helianthus annuus]KAJ0782276.1 putative RNA-directed DNA polymerase [Helianthus annuus]
MNLPPSVPKTSPLANRVPEPCIRTGANCELGNYGFEDVVYGVTKSSKGSAWGDKDLLDLLKSLKLKIKEYSSKAKENKDRKVAVDSLAVLEKCAEHKSLDYGEKESRANWKAVLRKLEKQKCMELKQKARIDWIKYGDENTSFFHNIINLKKASNRISAINIDGSVYSDPIGMKKKIMQAFKSKFAEPMVRRPKLAVNEFCKLSLNHKRSLTALFSEAEIKNAVWECGGDKSPGPDGFSFKFIKRFWGELKPRFMELMHQFYTSGNINHGCNTSFFTLIPKVQDPQKLADYRPISLIGVVYKVIAKTLANRLKGVMNTVSSPTQSAFIEERNIFDGPLIVNEVISWAKRQKKGDCVI